ncbi:MAG: hypothetical protein ACRC06_08290, partial [Waterburya sp.]
TKNQGKLILDATCAPGDISYPHDLGILNKARRQTEKSESYLNSATPLFSVFLGFYFFIHLN